MPFVKSTKACSLIVALLMVACGDTREDGAQADYASSNDLYRAGAQAKSAKPAVSAFEISVEGTPARGYVARPPGKITQLVVCAHGMGHTAEEWKPALALIASRGALAVAMDYSPMFDLDRGGVETVAAARYWQQRYPEIATSYLLSVSMGTSAAAFGVAGSQGVFDYWVNAEGLANLVESYAEAKAFGHPAATAMEGDTGGTPATATAAYEARSGALQPAKIVAHGMRAMIFVHSLNDGLVPVDQAREFVDGVLALGLPVDFYGVVRGPCSDQGTTGTGAVGLFNPLCLAGHATETHLDHPVMSTALRALFELMGGQHAPDGYHEYVVDQPAE